MFQIIECPRDAMQGFHEMIKTDEKIQYLNRLLEVGFPILDCGSFVSSKAIPQMADTKVVLDQINDSETKLSVIIANLRGAERAMKHKRVDVLGFPFSISETFQQYNTNKSRKEAFIQIQQIQKELENTNKVLMIYFSMAFGNPYSEAWDIPLVLEWINQFESIGVKHINLSDTIGIAKVNDIKTVFSKIQPYTNIEFGAHFHTEYNQWHEKVWTAFQNGCRKFDGAIRGFGGCPMAKSELVGNMPTEKLLSFAQEHNLNHNLDLLAFESAYNQASKIFL